MWSIAQKHNVSAVALQELNKMGKDSKIKVGQKIKVP